MLAKQFEVERALSVERHRAVDLAHRNLVRAVDDQEKKTRAELAGLTKKLDALPGLFAIIVDEKLEPVSSAVAAHSQTVEHLCDRIHDWKLVAGVIRWVVITGAIGIAWVFQYSGDVRTWVDNWLRQ